MPKTIKEFQLNQSTGEVSVEYSDDSTSKFNAADMVTAQTDAVTGAVKLIKPSGGYMAPRDLGWSAPYTPLNASDAGTLAANIGTSTVSNLTGAAVVTSGNVNSVSGKALQLTGTGSGTSVADISVNLPIGTADNWIGFWAYKDPAYSPCPVGMFVTGDNFVNFSVSNILIYPGLNFYVVPLPVSGAGLQPFYIGGGTGFTIPGTATKIRFRDKGSMTGVGYSALPNGQTVLIGDIYLNPVAPKAKFLLCFDDCKTDLIVPGGSAIAGGDGVARTHSYASFVQSYGFRTSAYIITGAVGATGFCSQYQLAQARDRYGVVFGAHSHSHPGGADVAGSASDAGLRLLGPYGYGLTSGAAFTSGTTGLSVTPTNDSSAIISDLQTCLTNLNKWGLGDATKHFALPQGGADRYVNAALETFGFKTVRGVQSNAVQHQWANGTFSVNGAECLSMTENLASSYQTDPGVDPGAAAIQAYVDRVIRFGGVGTNYCHSFGSSAVAKSATKALCDYLASKRDQIDVVTLADF